MTTKKVLTILGALGGAFLILVEQPAFVQGQERVRRAEQGTGKSSDPRLYIRPGSEPIEISVQDGRLHDILREVAGQTQAQLWMSPGVENRHLSYSAAGVPVRDVMSELCERDRCRWKVVTTIVVWDSKEPTPEWSLSPAQGRQPWQ